MTRPPGSASSRSYRPDVDGLRSLAILSVVLFHAGVRSLSGGFTGVDVFFVISGYLIGGHIDTELATGTFSFWHFYKNRAKRILPALYVVILAVLAIGLALLSPRELRDLAMYVFATVASASNIALWRTTGYFAQRADQNPLLMTWSLGIEEQFYLVIPLLLVLLARFQRKLMLPLIVAISALSFCVALFQVTHNPDSAFYLLDSRAWELGVGVALAMLEARSRTSLLSDSVQISRARGWLGLLLIVTPFFLLRASTPFPGLAALPSVLGAALLLSSKTSFINQRLLSHPWLVFVGRVSYSFYLVHWPLLSFLRILRGTPLPLAWGLTAIALAFGLAVLSYFFVEIPFRSSRRPAPALLLRYGSISLLLLLFSGIVFRSGGLPGRYAQAAALDTVASAAISTNHDPCLAERGESLPRLNEACIGSTVKKDHLALWGDSHASAMAEGLRSQLGVQSVFVEEYAKTTCPPLLGVGRSYPSDPALLTECIRFNDAVLHRLISDPRIKVVLLEAYWDAPFDPDSEIGKLATSVSAQAPATPAGNRQILQSALTLTLRKLVASGKRVVVFGDTPVFKIDPVWRMRSNFIPLRRSLASLLSPGSSSLDPGVDQASDITEPQRAAQSLLEQIATSSPGVTFWSMRQHLCIGDLCSYRQQQHPLFVDTNHVSTQGARQALDDWKLPSAIGVPIIASEYR